MMVNTVVNLGLWSSMAKTLGRICHQTFIAAADVQEIAGSNWEGEVSRVVFSFLNLPTSCSSCCAFTLKAFLWFGRYRQRGASYQNFI